ncbi:MAG: tetratricopeptide repeat protein, partial [Cyanobacteria bacterium P01_A01_bin.17]
MFEVMKVLDSTAKIRACLAERKWAKAAALCEYVLEQDPDCVDVYPLWGRVLTIQGQVKDAIQVYEKSLKLQSRHAGTYADLGYLFRRERRFAKAVAHYQLALSLKPDWVAVRYNLATLLYELGDWDAAIEQYCHVIKLQPTHNHACFNLAVVYGQKRKVGQAIELYRRVIREHPEESSAYSNLGDILSRQAKHEEALEVYQQGLAVHPEDAKLLNNLGLALARQGNLGDAIATYQSAISLDPGLAISHHNLGSLWLQHQDYPQAVTCFQRVLALEPKNIDALSDCGHALMLSGQWQAALDYLRSAMALQPKFVDVFCQRVKRLAGKDALEKARIACAQFLNAMRSQAEISQIQEFLWQTYWFVGEVLHEYGAFAQAEGYYHKAMGLNPRHVESYLRLGNCLAQQERQDAAVATYRMGLALNPIHPQLNVALGWVLERQGHFRAAMEIYEQVLPALQEQVDVTPSASEFPVPQGIYPKTATWVQARASEQSKTKSQLIQIRAGDLPTAADAPIAPSAEQAKADCGGVTCAECMTHLIQSFSSAPLGRQVFRCQDRPSLTPPPSFVAIIPKGRAWIAPQTNAWMICKQIAIITADNYILGDLSRFYPWSLPGCQKHDLSQHPLLKPVSLPPVEKL